MSTFINTLRLTSDAKPFRSLKFAVFSRQLTTTHNISGKNTFILILYVNINRSMFYDNINPAFSIFPYISFKFKNTNGHTVCVGALWFIQSNA